MAHGKSKVKKELEELTTIPVSIDIRNKLLILKIKKKKKKYNDLLEEMIEEIEKRMKIL